MQDGDILFAPHAVDDLSPNASMTSQIEPMIARRLAERICTFSATQITAKARAQAKACILDAIGVTLAGMKEPCTELLRQVPGVGSAPGPCLIFGGDQRTTALDATLINGTASHALDYDDFSAVMGAHHSVPLVPMLVDWAKSAESRGRNSLPPTSSASRSRSASPEP